MKTNSKLRVLWMVIALLVCVTAPASAGVIRVDEGSFVAGSGLITFSEKSLGTVNPTYVPADYGGGVGSPTVTFEGFLTGQALGTAITCPAGAALTGCVVGSPSTNPIALDSAAPDTFITTDGSFPTSPTLSGSPLFNGPITMLFSVDMVGVGLQGGYFNAIGGTAITAFARDGSVLGSVLNTAIGIEFLGLVTDDGLPQIAALQFSLVGAEPAGFNIDNVRFGAAGEVVLPGAVPEPGSWILIVSGIALLAAFRKRFVN